MKKSDHRGRSLRTPLTVRDRPLREPLRTIASQGAKFPVGDRSENRGGTNRGTGPGPAVWP